MQQERKSDKKIISLFWIFTLIILAVAALVVTVVFMTSESSFSEKYDIIYIIASGLISLVIILYTFFNKGKVLSTVQKLVTIGLLFSFPGLLLLITENNINFPFWMLGGVLIACLVDVNLGLYISYFYVLQAAHLQENLLKGLIVSVVTVTALCIITKFLKSFISLIYSAVIISCVALTTSLLLNKLVLYETFNTVSLYLIITFIIILIVCFTCKYMFIDSFDESIEGSDDSLKNAKNTAAQGFVYLNEFAESTQNVTYTNDNDLRKTANIKNELDNAINALPTYDETLKPYCDENAELLLKLKTLKRNSFMHSLRVSRLAGKCADGLINVDANLVRAVALYHEIGKIREGDVYTNTINIATEHKFPDKLVDCLKGCARQTENGIFSCEAAVVLIADTVVTTYYFLKSTNAVVFPEKLVDSVIGKEITQGRLNSSGLSLKDCNYIREFFVNTINRLEKR